MAEWRLKPLEGFPRLFHEALAQGEGEDKVLARRLRRVSAEGDRTQWNIFRWNVRQTPASPLHKLEEGLIHRTRITYNVDLGMWELLLTSRKRVLEDIVSMT